MKLTYNQIIKLLRDFTEAHFILKSFGNGEPWELVESSRVSDINYPMMWVQDQANTIQQGEEIYNFRIYFLNQVATLKEKTDSTLNETNVNEVKSDMRQCATDLISYFAQDTNYPDLNINRTVSLTSFTEDFKDTLTGWYIDLRFNQAFNYSSCNLPIYGIPTPPSVTCEDGIININSISFSNVVSGGVENILVKDTNGLEVGSKIGDEWIVPSEIAGSADVTNSNDTYNETVNAGDTLILPDINNIDSNGDVVPTPAQTPFTCSPCSGGQIIYTASGQNVEYLTYDEGYYDNLNEFSNDFLTDFHTLKNINEWGHLKRFTGDTGGFLDEATGVFYDSNGVPTTYALAFPNDNYRDYYTRKKWNTRRTGAVVYNTLPATISTATKGGETGWRLPTINEYFSIMYNGDLYSDYVDKRIFNWSVFNMGSLSIPKDDTTRFFQFNQATGVSFKQTRTSTVVGSYIKNF